MGVEQQTARLHRRDRGRCPPPRYPLAPAARARSPAASGRPSASSRSSSTGAVRSTPGLTRALPGCAPYSGAVRPLSCSSLLSASSTAAVLLPPVNCAAARSISATTSGLLIVTTLAIHYLSTAIMISQCASRLTVAAERFHKGVEVGVQLGAGLVVGVDHMPRVVGLKADLAQCLGRHEDMTQTVACLQHGSGLVEVPFAYHQPQARILGKRQL